MVVTAGTVVESITVSESVERMNHRRYLKLYALISLVQFPTHAQVL
jgi:hypothetical protein